MPRVGDDILELGASNWDTERKSLEFAMNDSSAGFMLPSVANVRTFFIYIGCYVCSLQSFAELTFPWKKAKITIKKLNFTREQPL